MSKDAPNSKSPYVPELWPETYAVQRPMTKYEGNCDCEHFVPASLCREFETKYNQARAIIALVMDEPTDMGVFLANAEKERYIRCDELQELRQSHDKMKKVLTELKSDPTLWKKPRAGGQDQYAGLPPAIRLIDEALRNES